MTVVFAELLAVLDDLISVPPVDEVHPDADSTVHLTGPVHRDDVLVPHARRRSGLRTTSATCTGRLATAALTWYRLSATSWSRAGSHGAIHRAERASSNPLKDHELVPIARSRLKASPTRGLHHHVAEEMSRSRKSGFTFVVRRLNAAAIAATFFSSRRGTVEACERADFCMDGQSTWSPSESASAIAISSGYRQAAQQPMASASCERGLTAIRAAALLGFCIWIAISS